MNDPGLDDPITAESAAAEQQYVDEDEEVEEEEQAFLAPSRWWFASTAFPLVAGTFGPMASAFSICALVVHWRMIIPPGQTEEDGVFVDDPTWLTVVNAVQLAIALISNLALLLNMARRLRFSIAQPITIIGWYISSFALVGLTATASGPLMLDDGQNYAYSQAFYYGIFSAGLYFLVASLMAVTVYGAWAGHYDAEFKLTMSQRTLMLQTISFLVYLLGGSAVFAHIEGWNYLDAVYWTDYTLLTVGIGDFAPATHLGRSLLFPFAIGGIIILGLVIGSIRSLVLERGKVKMEARMVEKERQRILKRFERKGKTGLLEPVRPNTEDSSSGFSVKPGEDLEAAERRRRQEEFQLMRKIQARAADRRRWLALSISATTWFVLWFAGAAVFWAAEDAPQGWTYFVALYFSYTSLLTIGYGDVSPVSNSGKAFFVFWSLLAVPSLTILISNMGDTIVKAIRDLTLWIGEFTVLPGEHGVRAAFKNAAYTITGGRIFDGDTGEQPPGFLGEAQKRNYDSGDEEQGNGGTRHRKNDPESAAQRAQGDNATRDVEKAKDNSKDNDKRAIPDNKKHYHLLLVKEIQEVMGHLNSSPPRKYTFDEWAWYLRLIGEDESDPTTHRRAPRKIALGSEGMEGLGTAVDQAQQKKIKWSWVGNRSPLMGNKEEAEWVLERLVKTLENELGSIKSRERTDAGGDRHESDDLPSADALVRHRNALKKKQEDLEVMIP